jgi:hypothetical protein
VGETGYEYVLYSAGIYEHSDVPGHLSVAFSSKDLCLEVRVAVLLQLHFELASMPTAFTSVVEEEQ